VFILEEPYVSTLLRDTVAETSLPVLDTPMARMALEGTGVVPLGDEAFAAAYGRDGRMRLYANSENAIGWISEHLSETDLPRQIALFKDKVVFRELLADLHPGYGFCGIDLAGLRDFDPTSLRFPFVVKPAVGFFSMGVHIIDSAAAWPRAVDAIERDAAAFATLYPGAVLDFGRFIAEEVIDGDEYAIDAYYDADGTPVIVNIYSHLFASAEDVSDRVYFTSTELIERWREPFTAFLVEVGKRANLHDFPVHAELRVSVDGTIAPIEINPMRFGGWCSTDLAHFAYGINPYTTYLRGETPDWKRVVAERAGTVTALVIADVPSTTDLAAIESVDFDGFASRFSHVLELRPVDFNRYPVFAFTFVTVPAEDLSELRTVLGADLTGYLRMRGE